MVTSQGANAEAATRHLGHIWAKEKAQPHLRHVHKGGRMGSASPCNVTLGAQDVSFFLVQKEHQASG